MRLLPILTTLPLATNAINVVQSNDDGWAEINIRYFYNSLTAAGFQSFISAPADNQSGTGSRDEEPMQVGERGCHFHSCPAQSPPIGRNESIPRFNYVNSYPVTAMRHGIQKLSQEFYGGVPDLAVAGPNVGVNVGLFTQLSGTVGASVEAVKLGVPAIAFSGASGKQTAWNNPTNEPVEPYVQTYADLSARVAQVLTNGSKPYLPEGIWLNVNYPILDWPPQVDRACAGLGDYKFVLSRIYPAEPNVTGDDIETCGSKRLPTESKVVDMPGCWASISVGNLDKKDAGADAQKFVLERFKSILSCLKG